MSTRKISSASESAVDYFREPLGFLQSTLLVLLLVGSLEMGFLFNTVCSYALMTLAFYEMIQVQTYLQMLGLSKARLVEQYNQERMSYSIDVNHDQWNDNIVPKLTEFCKTLHHYMSN